MIKKSIKISTIFILMISFQLQAKEALNFDKQKVDLKTIPHIKYNLIYPIKNIKAKHSKNIEVKHVTRNKKKLIKISSKNQKKSRILETGMLTYFLNIDAEPYQALQIKIKNNSANICKMQIELFDDDNNNKVIEVYKKQPHILSQDDKFIYTEELKNNTWETLICPINTFYDNNKNTGDNIWNPNQNEESGGLIQMQILFISEKKADNTKPNNKIDIFLESINLLGKQTKIIKYNDYRDYEENNEEDY
eukprot:COSAG01_NODE_1461_length_10242_cov_4.896283_4_plen_249_part_00